MLADCVEPMKEKISDFFFTLPCCQPTMFSHKRPFIVVVLLSLVALLLVAARPSHKVPQRRGPNPGIRSYKLNDVVASFDAVNDQEQVLILTPLVTFTPAYWANLIALSYPHSLIELGFIVPADAQGDQTLAHLNAAVKGIQTGPTENRFAKITILRKEPSVLDPVLRQRPVRALKRQRAALASMRNSLVLATIGPKTAWVLWLDSDVVETPASLVQDLASYDKPLIVANCYQRQADDKLKPVDACSWQESAEQAEERAMKLGPDEIVVQDLEEGSSTPPVTGRALLAHMYDPAVSKAGPEEAVPLDGVAATALLVKAQVHRDGAMFPPFAFYNLVGSEGFAKMAARLGYNAWGLPNYLVYRSEP